MGLRLGAASSDVIDVGSGASIDDLDPFSILILCYPTSTTTDLGLWEKSPTNALKKVFLRKLTGVGLYVARATSASYRYPDTGTGHVVVANQWQMFAATFNSAASPNSVLYGSLASDPVKAYTTFTTQNADGSGALTSDAADTARWGNWYIGAGSLTSAFQGILAIGAVVNRVLTLDEIRDWQFNPRWIPGTVDFHHFGANGTGVQQDLSGNKNDGTVTGATVADHVPLSAYTSRYTRG